MQMNTQVLGRRTPAVEINKVLRNTFTLLSLTLIFSAVTAFFGVVLGISPMMGLVADLVALGLLWFALPRTANSASGIPMIFLITGLLGFGLGPVVAYYLSLNPAIVLTALGGTGAIFLGLAGYALTTRRDFSFMGGFLMVGLMVILGASLLNIFLGIPALSLAVSGGIILVMSGLILFEVSQIIYGGETNYIMATASLYLSILNIFQALLQILGVFSGDD